jgi:hypothetical protein
VLTHTVSSPLVGHLPESRAVDEAKPSRPLIPAGVNLDDVALVRYKPNSAKKPVSKDNDSASKAARQIVDDNDPWI